MTCSAENERRQVNTTQSEQGKKKKVEKDQSGEQRLKEEGTRREVITSTESLNFLNRREKKKKIR